MAAIFYLKVTIMNKEKEFDRIITHLLSKEKEVTEIINNILKPYAPVITEEEAIKAIEKIEDEIFGLIKKELPNADDKVAKDASAILAGWIVRGHIQPAGPSPTGG